MQNFARYFPPWRLTVLLTERFLGAPFLCNLMKAKFCQPNRCKGVSKFNLTLHFVSKYNWCVVSGLLARIFSANNKGLGTLIYWFFNDCTLRRYQWSNCFLQICHLCFDFVIFLTMFWKGLIFVSFKLRRIEKCGELEEELGEQIWLWYIVYMYESLRR